MNFFAGIALALFPVLFFLAGLYLMDSFRLLRLRSVAGSLAAGAFAAGADWLINGYLLQSLNMGPDSYAQWLAPVLEETLKGVFLVYLNRKRKIGFFVDSAIHGFAIGAGFAFVENLVYFSALGAGNLFVWFIRGFGTAMMHGGTTAIFGILSKNLTDRHFEARIIDFLPGLAAAVLIHSFFNRFVLPPVLNTLVLLALFPLLIVLVFDRSEKSLRKWLGVGFDLDVKLLDTIIPGNIGDTKLGQYLHFLKESFPGDIVADMLCLLRVHLELSVRAKGILMLSEAGFKVARDAEIQSKFEEMEYLRKRIGKTGLLAISPFLHTSSRELWQWHLLKKNM